MSGIETTPVSGGAACIPADAGPSDAALWDMPAAGLSHIAFSFTNRCNLRCVYCPQGTHPDDFHAETPKEQIERIIAYALEKRVSRISIGYYGETMLVDGWEKAVEPLFDQGFILNLVSNFSKVMTPAEVAAVSRFQEVQISIDTIDIPLLKQVRKAVDARTILYNTHLIRAHVLRHGLPMPKLIWTSVLTDRVAEGMPDLVATAISSSVPAINCVEVAYIDGVGANAVRHLNDAEEDVFRRGFAAVHEARRLALRHGVSFALGGAERMARRALALYGRQEFGRITRTLTGLDDLDAGRRIFIYGAGSVGHALRNRLPDRMVAGFIDSERHGTLDGLPLLSFDLYRQQRTADDLILIGSSFEDEIEGRLLAHGIDGYRRAFRGLPASAGIGQGPDGDDTQAAAGGGPHLRRQGIQGEYSFSGDALDDLPPGMTRMCTTPWTNVFLAPKGEAYACCFRGQVMGTLKDDGGIDGIMAGEAYRDLRRRLLSGTDLDPECRLCTGSAMVTPQELREQLIRLAQPPGGQG
ncbi:hypothetical protein J2848_005913 [Azospirillum lipoferum]|nr:radical SAM protein [Azospirillum sp. NL1]MCP1614210.1 hypothetical protein [Azospirillum lipoferum]MDW5536895.1 SPASM domain-containing protein [Azospirillum sp. NL1]